jgi:DNA (cytosine-5)-methyltransferase 1
MLRPIAVDLFSGAGGLSLGFEQAGFDVVAALEVDPVHAAVHAFNFPECATICRDISKVSGAEIRTAAEIGRRKVDVVFGGAPCQGFSLIGQRALDDPRNALVRQFMRIVRELDADYFVFENVKGLTLGRHRAFLEELVRSFERHGYSVRKPWQVLNAAAYGVPQSRERLILFGAKKGKKLPQYPLPIPGPGPNCRDALDDLPNADAFAALCENDEIKVPRKGWGRPSVYARGMRCLTNDCWHYGRPREWDPGLLTSSMRTGHTVISQRRFKATAQGEVEPISRFFKLPPDGVSNTLRAGTDAARGAFTSPRPIHYRYPRVVTVREMARLHGFPDWFRLQETKWHGARQVGNAVPPPLARAVAGEVIKALGLTPRTLSKAIPLGDPALLRMTVRRAAEHWGIPAPNGKRDRKSGATKRRQSDIEAELGFLVAAE